MGNVVSAQRQRYPEVQQLLSWAKSLFIKYELGDGITYIDQAIIVDRKALDLCPPDHPKRCNTLFQLHGHLWYRFKQLGTMTDIEEAIVVAREVVGLCPPRHICHSMSLNRLALSLSERYQQLGETTDLNAAIALGRKALEHEQPWHPSRPVSLNNLSCCFYRRYQQLGVVADLDEAIALGRQALNLHALWQQDRKSLMDNLASYFHERYLRLGRMADLNKAVVLGRGAHDSDSCSPAHPDRSISLSGASGYLYQRYERLGGMVDLNRAIDLGKEALHLLPQAHPDRSISLNNVANCFFRRYQELGEMTDLDESIILGREALDLRPSGHPLRPTSLGNVTIYLHERYKRLGKAEVLNEAIILGREALHLRPPGHPDRPLSLRSLAGHLAARFKQFSEIADLNEAVYLAEDALESCPTGHPDRSRSLDKLAGCLHVRFDHLGQLKDKENLFCAYTELAQISQSMFSVDVLVSKGWVNVAEEFHHPSTILAYETALRLLVHHLATLPSLPQYLPVLKELTSSLAVDSFSACLRNQSPKSALELLEQGRTVFWNQVTRLSSPFEDVITSGTTGKILADEFSRLTSSIRDTMNSSSADRHDRLCNLNLNLQNIITDIRKLPGLQRFLLPSLFSDLQHAASNGPVIIVNASKYTCDALVVFTNRDPVHIPLQVTKSYVQDLASELQSLTLQAKKMDVTRDLGRFLRDLWDEVVFPIVDFLRTTVPAQSRIWWCPTAEFSLLPLHAAGPYRKGQHNLSHLYISSYTPTLTALIRARRPDSTSSTTNKKRLVAIGQATAAGESELASVGSELTVIGQHVQSLATFTRVEGPESCVSRVSEELKKNEWAHLACHGIPNKKEPFESAFALHDGRFTIERIIQLELENPQFAYLSACHTTVGDEESPDEVIHLAAAMQFAGFRSVIGTMWAVDDSQTRKITSKFYEHMVDESGCLDHTRAAFALNKTMNSIVDIPLDQRILYVHIGA